MFTLFTSDWGKNVIIFGVDNSLSVLIDKRKKIMLILGEGQTDGLDDTKIATEDKYSINITESRKKNCLSLHYNGKNSFWNANGVNISHFKTKDPETKIYPLCLGNISNVFTIFITREIELRGYVYDFHFDLDSG